MFLTGTSSDVMNPGCRAVLPSVMRPLLRSSGLAAAPARRRSVTVARRPTCTCRRSNVWSRSNQSIGLRQSIGLCCLAAALNAMDGGLPQRHKVSERGGAEPTRPARLFETFVARGRRLRAQATNVSNILRPRNPERSDRSGVKLHKGESVSVSLT